MELVVCRDCDRQFPAVEGIPDLRESTGDTQWQQHDLEVARANSAELRSAGLQEVVEQLSGQSDVSEDTRSMRVRQIMTAPPKFRHQFESWLRPCMDEGALVLDVGCGTGGLLAGAHTLGIQAAGIDASMANLIAAKHMIEAHGGTARLACAYAESLPLLDGQFTAVTMYDAIEHVDDVTDTISEACRVLRPGGFLGMSTPNRYSLTREPHVLIWGVGWLPRALQQPYVKWRTGKDYEQTCLISTWAMRREMQRHPEVEFEIRIPQVPHEEIAGFTALRARLAELYNRVAGWRLLRPLLLAVGPFYQVTARRRD